MSASTQNQALAALLFLYGSVLQQPLGELGELGEVVHAQRPRRLPVVMTREEVSRLLGRLTGTRRLMLRCCTVRGCGCMNVWSCA